MFEIILLIVVTGGIASLARCAWRKTMALGNADRGRPYFLVRF